MSKKRVLPVAVLLCGVLAGAGWAAMAQPSHAESGASTVLATTASRTTTATRASTTSARTTPKPTAGKPKPSARRASNRKPAGVTAQTVQQAVHAVDPSATVGAMLVDRESGKTLLAVGTARRFHSASLVKLLIAIDVLPGETDPDVRNGIATMLRMSDDNLASKYWVRQGGAGLVSRTAAKLGLRDTAPPTPAGQWGNTWLSPRDLVTIYQYVLGHMDTADRAVVVNALASAPEHAADGFDQWFGIPDGLHGQWAIKQGWSSSRTDICLHSTGLVGQKWRYIVIVLTEHGRGTSFATGTRSATAGVHALQPLLQS